MEPLMLNELWWAVPEKLAGMRKPATIVEVNSLKPAVAAIISLLDDEENHELYQEADMPFLWLPVTGGKTPSSEQVAQARSYYTEVMQAGNGAVAIHCSGGRKRTATLIGAILTETMTGDEVLDLIAEVNPDITLNEGQVEFVSGLG